MTIVVAQLLKSEGAANGEDLWWVVILIDLDDGIELKVECGNEALPDLVMKLLWQVLQELGKSLGWRTQVASGDSRDWHVSV